LLPGIAGSNPAGGMDVYHLCLYIVLSFVGRGPCDEMFPSLRDSYHVSNKDSETPQRASEDVNRRSNPKIQEILNISYLVHDLLRCGVRCVKKIVLVGTVNLNLL
jgi:hypothetical protein